MADIREWSFEQELRFISNLGTHSGLVERGAFTRRQLLCGYAIGLAKRAHGFTAEQHRALRERIEVELRQLPPQFAASLG